MSENVFSADNQQGSPLFATGNYDPSETTRRTPLVWKRQEVIAYLQGAMHDASLNKGCRVRFVQKYPEWLRILQILLKEIQAHSWIYKEGRNRSLYVLETTSRQLNFDFDPLRLESKSEKAAYLRGFFDSEGGVPRNGKRFYIQLTQKDQRKVGSIKSMLDSLGIRSGKVHNPSNKIDPSYWRIFVSSQSYTKFARIIGSYHPVKAVILHTRG